MLLRPEPGLSASAVRARALGLDVICRPLFQIEPIAWEAPDPSDFEGLLITSANAIRHGGSALDNLKEVPVYAVGAATASAAQTAGFNVAEIGDGNADSLLDRLPPSLRLLHLAGEDHRNTGNLKIDRRIVYRSVEIDEPQLPDLKDLVAAVHSPRAGARLSDLSSERCRTAIAAISADAAEACGGGWEQVEAAAEPNDNCLLALAAMLCHTSPPR
ncbi:MAG: uroporphyrinogen-III synthase [Sphingomicrobium sp.]